MATRKKQKDKQQFMRVSLTLEPDVVAHATRISKKIGVSRSAFVNELLKGTLGDMWEAIKHLPEEPTVNDMNRLRGASIALVGKKMEEFGELVKTGEA